MPIITLCFCTSTHIFSVGFKLEIGRGLFKLSIIYLVETSFECGRDNFSTISFFNGFSYFEMRSL